MKKIIPGLLFIIIFCLTSVVTFAQKPLAGSSLVMPVHTSQEGAPDPIPGKLNKPVFTGTGLNDLSVDNQGYHERQSRIYTVTISGNGTPDTFDWSSDAGDSDSGVEISTGPAGNDLVDGVRVYFAAGTGHHIGDSWTITATAYAITYLDENGLPARIFDDGTETPVLGFDPHTPGIIGDISPNEVHADGLFIHQGVSLGYVRIDAPGNNNVQNYLWPEAVPDTPGILQTNQFGEMAWVAPFDPSNPYTGNFTSILVHDATPSTGSTQFNLQAGEAQDQYNPLMQIYDANSNFNLRIGYDGTIKLAGLSGTTGDSVQIVWTEDQAYSDPSVGIGFDSAGNLRITDGTNSGTLGGLKTGSIKVGTTSGFVRSSSGVYSASALVSGDIPDLSGTYAVVGRQVIAGTGLSGGGTLAADRTLSVTDNTTTQKVKVSKAGSLIGTRSNINFIEGSNVTIATSDNSGSDRMDITIAATGGGGGSTAWSGITDPSGNLALTMAANTTVLTYNATTSTSDLFKLTDTSSNTGTGALLAIAMASSSSALAMRISKATIPTTLDVPYAWLGKGEFSTTGYQLLGFGYYDGSASTKPTVVIGEAMTATSGATGGDFIVGVRASNANTAPAEYMRIKAGGKVGFGISGPTAKVEIWDGTDATVNVLGIYRASQGNIGSPTTDMSKPYVTIGHNEYAVNMYEGIGFGWQALTSNPTAFIGYQMISTSGNTYGDIVLGTRVAGTGNAPTERLRIDSSGNFTYFDGGNFILGSTTGTKIGTSTSQKLAFYNSTPITKPAALTAANALTIDGTYDSNEADTITNLRTRLNDLESRLQSLGLLQ